MKLYKTKHKYHPGLWVLTTDGDKQLNGLVSRSVKGNLMEKNLKNVDIISFNTTINKDTCLPEDSEVINHILKTYDIIETSSGLVTKSQVWYNFIIEAHKDFNDV